MDVCRRRRVKSATKNWTMPMNNKGCSDEQPLLYFAKESKYYCFAASASASCIIFSLAYMKISTRRFSAADLLSSYWS